MTETLVESTNQLSISQEDPVVENKDLDNEHDEHAVSSDEEDDENGGSTASHPLEYEWTFWYDKRPAVGKRLKGEQDSYESNLRAIGTFGTVSLLQLLFVSCWVHVVCIRFVFPVLCVYIK
jgi:hypothetical protein